MWYVSPRLNTRPGMLFLLNVLEYAIQRKQNLALRQHHREG